MKCTVCGGALRKSIGDHLYLESGLENIVLRDVTKYDCASCGAKRLALERMGQLHRLLAHSIATKPARLVPSEVRFIRDHLGLSNKDFAALMGVSEYQASRWTNSDPIGVPAERYLRVLATLTPRDLEKVRSALPSKLKPAKPRPVRVVRTANAWKIKD